MINARRSSKKVVATKADAYRTVFVSRVHQLLELGYLRTTPKTFLSYQETAITGELVRAMDLVIDDPASPRWVRHFSVHDDPPVNAKGRLGRSRKRLDIKVVSTNRIPRSRFSFEAKRLGKDHPVGDYLGTDGLGCFLTGDYAREEIDAGMLGYVQSHTPHDWAQKLGAELNINATPLCVVKGDGWKHRPFGNGPSYTYHTRHARKAVNEDIEVFHTLLLCC